MSMLFVALKSRIFLDILLLMVVLSNVLRHETGVSFSRFEILIRTWSVMPLTHGVKAVHDDQYCMFVWDFKGPQSQARG